MVFHGLTGDVFIIMIKKHLLTSVGIKVDKSAVMGSPWMANLILSSVYHNTITHLPTIGNHNHPRAYVRMMRSQSSKMGLGPNNRPTCSPAGIGVGQIQAG